MVEEVQIVKKSTQITPPVKTEPPQRVFEKKKAIFRTYQFIWYVLWVIEVLLGFRIFLKVVGANPLNGFTRLVYDLSEPFAAPFRGIVDVTVSGNFVFEWSTFIAGAVYALLAYALVTLMQFIKPVTPQEVEEEVDK